MSGAAAPGGLWLALRRLCSAGRQQADGAWATRPPPLPARRPPATAPAVPEPVAEATQFCTGSSAAVSEALAPTSSANRASVIAAAVLAAGKADARAERLHLQMQEANETDSEAWRQRGDALRAKRVAAEFVPVSNTSEDLQEREGQCFKQAEKIERTRARCAPLAAAAVAEAASWRSAVAELPEAEACQSLPESSALSALHSRLCQAGLIKEAKTAAPADPAALLRRKYGKEIDCFLSPNGHEVVVGRSAGANERVSFELAWKDGFWFHADSGVAGSHAAILCRAGEVACLEDVEFAASLAAWHSKARSEPLAAVCFCAGDQLSRPRIPKLGQVHILGRRGQLHVVPAPPSC